ncbi:UDP-N-acetylmuramoyl-tripeptide--D-alanyl-D-alanine ligase [Rhodococcus sp. HNM0563]|uniref:UDP-N-acetylmuramoyl-tripeptide--D-alanyl-D- alanine ligase n=1 Tax=unclassified Rhodococcus (in: high G+C Gram-positive bacteria) TaxID=192944 RepID=UPI00146ABCD6|nr:MULTISPECIES: UDP-N-acetylmuramoyl-tripeptide--D-alanyl-D-alanine ligase [unclassified Rhodococcus (in: high G+C Gram-positive bacteria)]MCK0092902.1 UDP-N-acetylmuramoyl-tripeptide--D-alanyl-D-alanine ligase [Rhodococcus sp. F64268]NLU61194.1 UDP-N-acetylmuramoyl-tripeptide--D-alanyl-D-alanine ligase [Rhodococcus sp. HNM0563]
MIPMTLARIAEAVGGTLHDVDDPAVEVTGTVEFDSRRIAEGGLFLALPGAKTDGHDHAAAAIDAGAVAVLAARPVGVPAIVVPFMPAAETNALALEHDPDGSGAAVLTGLAKLARTVVDELVDDGLTVIGVTGSSGKTSTKDLIAAVLAPLGPVVAPPGSFNNELGHPWTALRATRDTRFLVLEMSARGPGHIAALAQIAPPRIGAVLNVGTAHLGEFGSREVIAQTKGELVEALPDEADGGVAILNADDTLVARMAARTHARVVTVGSSGSAQVAATDITLDGDARPTFTLAITDRVTGTEQRLPVTLAVHGEHQVGNALTAIAIALECGATPEQAGAALAGAAPVSAHRMAVTTRADGVTVIDDAYNANPDSMRAALKALATVARSGPARRRTFAVLGEMGELGDESVVEHDAIGRFAVRLDISRIIAVGATRPVRGLFQGAVMEGSWGEEASHVLDADAAIELLRDEIGPGDIVLVKASQSVGLWSIAEALLGDDNAVLETEAAR